MKRKIRLSDVEEKYGEDGYGVGTKIHCIKHKGARGYVADLIDFDETLCGCPLSNFIVDELVLNEVGLEIERKGRGIKDKR